MVLARLLSSYSFENDLRLAKFLRGETPKEPIGNTYGVAQKVLSPECRVSVVSQNVKNHINFRQFWPET
jgi:hypothetical protein